MPSVTYKHDCVKIRLSIEEYNRISLELLKLLQKAGSDNKNGK